VRNLPGFVPRGFQRLRQLREPVRQLARDSGRTAAWVERQRVGPHGPQLLALAGFGELLQADAETAGIRRRQVGFARSREVGQQLIGVPHVDDDQKRRPAFVRREGSRVLFGLAASLDHRIVPALRPSHGGPAFGLLFRLRRQLESVVSVGFGLLRALFGLQHKAAAFVEVDASDAGRAVEIVELDVPLEHVSVLGHVRLRRLGMRHSEDVAQPVSKRRKVRPLSPTRSGPVRNEF